MSKHNLLCIHQKHTGVISLGVVITINIMLIFLFCGCCVVLTDVSTFDAIKTALYYIMLLLLPGGGAQLLLLPNQKDIITFSAISYAFGYGINILLYFLTVPFQIQAVIPYVTIAVAALSAMYIVKKSREKNVAFSKPDCIVVAVFFGYLVLSFVIYSGNVISPHINGEAWYPADQIWWVENAIALAQKFPPADLRIQGATLYYHYFASIQLAVANLCTGVNFFALSSSLYVLMKCCIFFGALYTLLQIMKYRSSRILGIISIICCTGVESICLVTYVSHSIATSFGFDIGLGIGAIVLYLFSFQYKKARIDYKLWIAILFFIVVLSGVKAPIAIIVIIAIGMPCFAWLFSGQIKMAFVYGVSILFGFCCVSVACAGLLNPELGRMGDFSLTGFFALNSLENYLSGLPFALRWCCSLLLGIFCINPLILSLFSVSGACVLLDRQKKNWFEIGLLIAGVSGFLLGTFNVQNGYSQMYFSMAALLPAMTLGWLGWEKRILSLKKRRVRLSLCCILVAVQMSLFFFNGYTFYGTGAIRAFRQGLYNITNREIGVKRTVEAIQATDLDALIWIRDCTPKDSVIVADRFIVGNMNDYMYYGVFSERQMFLEGDVYYFHSTNNSCREQYRKITRDIFANESEAITLAKQAGATHIVQTKWLTPEFAPNASLVTLVYESDSIAVYEII